MMRSLLFASFCSAARSLNVRMNAPVVTLTGGKAKLFKAGNPLVYGGAVKSVSGKPATGAVVDVVDGSGGFIGWGVFNPISMYRVRLLAHEEPALLAHRDGPWPRVARADGPSPARARGGGDDGGAPVALAAVDERGKVLAVTAARLVVSDAEAVARRASWATVVARRYGERLHLVDVRTPNRWTAAAASAAAAARFASAGGDALLAASAASGATLRCELLATHPRHTDRWQTHGARERERARDARPLSPSLVETRVSSHTHHHHRRVARARASQARGSCGASSSSPRRRARAARASTWTARRSRA